VKNYNINLKKNSRIAIITLGCSKNTVDSEFIAGSLNKSGFKAFHSNTFNNADAVLINTCSFILDAKEESIDVILQCLEAKKRGLLSYVFVMGCLIQRYKNKLQEELPDVDAFFTFNHNNEIVNALRGKVYNAPETRLISTPKHYAYLKISDGCNRNCSFCVIPSIKGKYISMPVEKLVEEANYLVDNGTKEIIIVAQNTAYYGKDLYKKGKLASLIDKLSKIDGVEWIRLHYLYPTDFTDDIIDVVRDNSKVCKYIDIPLQHISDRILHQMNRGMSKKDTVNLVEKLRNNIPDLAIRTTFITGFPGETKAEFNELKEFVELFQFERMGVFQYSAEEGTSAYNMKPEVPNHIKYKRAEELMLLQQEISYQNNLQKVGQKLKVIIDAKMNDYYIGRTQHDSPEIDNEVIIKSDKKIKIGDFIDVLINNAEEFDIFAEY